MGPGSEVAHHFCCLPSIITQPRGYTGQQRRLGNAAQLYVQVDQERGQALASSAADLLAWALWARFSPEAGLMLRAGLRPPSPLPCLGAAWVLNPQTRPHRAVSHAWDTRGIHRDNLIGRFRENLVTPSTRHSSGMSVLRPSANR